MQILPAGNVARVTGANRGIVHSPTPLWTPSPQTITSSHLARFARNQGFDPLDYDALHRWSISDLEGFWNALWDFSGVIGERGATTLLRANAGAMFGARWYPEARLNFAENLLCGAHDRLAVIQASENGVDQRITMGQLRAQVSSLAQGLRALGVTAGDVVSGILPNRVEALVALLACASIGAIWASCSPDFGAPGILDRIGQVHPKVLFAVTRYRYNGKQFDIADNLARILHGLHDLQHLVLVGDDTRPARSIQAGWRRDVNIIDWQQANAVAPAPIAYARLPFAHPLYIMFTSGTTGLPKAIVHTAGGVLLQHRKEHMLHCDVHPGDVMSWYTSTAWMMYHWLVSGLASHAAIVLYDGAAIVKRESAGHNNSDLGILWRVAEQTGTSHFGTSPKYLASLQDAGYEPATKHDLRPLRSVLSAGAPVQAEQFHWLYRAIKADMMFASISGGTEIIGCFVLGSPTHPVWPGEITCKALGHAVDVLDEQGVSCMGRKGNLVCTEPFPSMPLTFWGADGQARYHAAYFEQYPNIWSHGDLAEQTLHGSVIIYGRTDTTLKPGGVRIGTAEIYRVLERQASVQDALVFGWPIARAHGHDEEIVLCLLMKPGCALDQAFRQQLREAIRRNASPRHVPHHIFAVTAIPYTLNGKRVEGAARAAALGQPVKNLGSLSNPESLTQYAALFQKPAA